MAFEIREAELQSFIETMLDAYKGGRAGRATVIQLLTHALVACANDNEMELRAYICASKDSLTEQ